MRPVTRTETVVVGAGQAGLSLSRCLTDRDRDHVVLERGRVGERWRSERWDSFRLLTPNWATRLPGVPYDGPDPDGFMTRREIVDHVDRYAASFDAPVTTGVTVRHVVQTARGWRVVTDTGSIDARTVVMATGHHGVPRIPAVAGTMPAGVAHVHSSQYRNPAQLPDGAVLVVGAGPSGQQIAEELARAGRRVLIAVGRHRALPRRYRGLDAYRWMEVLGMLDRPLGPGQDAAAAARTPSVVLAGRDHDLSLRGLVRRGVEPVGHLLGVDGTVARFADDVTAVLAEADANHQRLRCVVDEHVARTGMVVPEPVPAPAPWAAATRRRLDLAAAGVGSVVWATGFRRDLSVVRARTTDAGGEPIHHRGISPLPGLLYLGLRWQSRRSSNFLAGVGHDAAFLTEWIDRHHRRGRSAA